MAEQLNVITNNPVVTPSGQTITTSIGNAARTAGSAVANSANAVVGDVGSYATGIIAGAVGQAIAPVIDVTKKAAQVYDLVTNPSLGGALALLGRGFPPYRNELDQFASYNAIWTLGCLTQLELNFPLSYRTLGPAIKIIKNGGTGGNKIPTIYETDGQREFFIEDVMIKNHVAPNNGTRTSNALVITFKVIEPYSMGQFFHNLRTAALVAGHANYTDAPFLLSVSFTGYDDEGNVKEPFFSKRHFPIRLAKSEMKVTAAGAEYEVTAYAYNEIALTDQINRVTTDVQLKGRTVAELLQTGGESLTAKLNSLEIEQVRAKQKQTADYYIISFPDPGIIEEVGGGLLSGFGATIAGGGQGERQRLYESISGDTGGEIPADLEQRLAELPGATTLGSPLAEQLRQTAASSINTIGQADINLDGVYSCSAQQEATFVENEDAPGTFTRGRITFNTNGSVFTFKNMSSITDIIEEVLLSSEFCRAQVRAGPDARGNRTWFKIHTHVYNGSGFLAGITGQSPKIYVYRVVPYTYPATRVADNTQGLLDSLVQQSSAVKAYNYIYTGQNSDIIDFDLTFNQTFYTGITSTRGQINQHSQTGGQNNMTAPSPSPTTTTDTGLTGIQALASAFNEVPARLINTPGPNNGGTQGGGGGTNNSENSIARDWHDMIINSENDMIAVDLTIHGDPYFLADAGIGNYLGISNPINQAITIDGSMNPVNETVTVILNFRTPIDYDEEDGFVKYPLGGFLPIAMFSGTYQVNLVENNFKQGKFTQTLKLVRLRNQDLSLKQIGSSLLTSIGNTAIGQRIGLGNKSNEMGEQQA